VHVRVEAANRRESTGYTALGKLAPGEVGEEPPDRGAVDTLPAPLACAIVGPEKADELREVATIRTESVGRHVALLLEVRQKIGDFGRVRCRLQL